MKMLDVKPFQETLNASMCGVACLKMVLDYYGVKKSEDDVLKLCNHDKDLGIDDREIERVAESLGFRVEIKNECEYSDIESWLEKDVPVIVDWFTRGRNDYPEDINLPDGHYSVVCGLDDTRILLQDPEIGGIRKIRKENFKRVWFDFRGELIKPDELIIRQIIAIYR